MEERAAACKNCSEPLLRGSFFVNRHNIIKRRKHREKENACAAVQQHTERKKV